MEAAHAGSGAQVTPLELFFDLVFVFALTQVTAMLAADPTWAGLVRGLLVLAALWWAWAAYAWLTKSSLAHLDEPLETIPAVGLCGGVAL